MQQQIYTYFITKASNEHGTFSFPPKVGNNWSIRWLDRHGGRRKYTVRCTCLVCLSACKYQTIWTYCKYWAIWAKVRTSSSGMTRRTLDRPVAGVVRNPRRGWGEAEGSGGGGVPRGRRPAEEEAGVRRRRRWRVHVVLAALSPAAARHASREGRLDA